jgi:tight adherence protein B
VGVIALLGGMGVAAGLWLAASGWARRQSTLRRSRRVQIPAERVAAAAAGCVVGLVLTRWPVAAAGMGAGTWFVAGWWQARGVPSAEKKAEALALWVEMLRDTVGTAKGLEGVIAVTASTAPPLIRPDVMRVAARLQDNVPLDRVLAELGAALDHPVSDLVVVALSNTAWAGGTKLGEVLDDLAAAAHGEAEVHRRLEVARTRPRATMRYVALAIAATVGALAVFARGYLEPYGTVGGQVVLVGIGAVFVAAFAWMHRLGRVRTIDRFLRPPT